MTDGRHARSERTRAALLEATLRLIVENGVDAVTQRKVAAAAGTSLASTTYHFPTADDLVVAAFEESTRRSREQFAAAADAVLAGEVDLLDAAMRFASNNPYADTERPTAALPHLIAAAAHNERLRHLSEASLAEIAAILAPLTTPPEAAATVARCLTGLLLHDLARGDGGPSADLRADVDHLFTAFGVTAAADRLRT